MLARNVEAATLVGGRKAARLSDCVERKDREIILTYMQVTCNNYLLGYIQEWFGSKCAGRG